MTNTTAGTLVNSGTRIAQRIYLADYDAVVFVDSPVWKRKEIELTDEEAEAVEKRLDAEDQEQKITFSSAKEAIDFLLSRIKRPHV